MEKLKLEIELQNDAFQDGAAWYEVMNILQAAANNIGQNGLNDFPLKDINGNTVGKVFFE